VKFRIVSFGVIGLLLAGAVTLGVGQTSGLAGASPLSKSSIISVGSQWTLEIATPPFNGTWECEVQTFESGHQWEVADDPSQGNQGSYHSYKSGAELKESIYGADPHDTFVATYEDSTTYFSGGTGPAYVGTYGAAKLTPKDRQRWPAELIPSVISGC
jgi:hypothetical protein